MKSFARESYWDIWESYLALYFSFSCLIIDCWHETEEPGFLCSPMLANKSLLGLSEKVGDRRDVSLVPGDYIEFV